MRAREKDELREAIVFLLENPVSDDDEVQANAILEEIEGGVVEKRFASYTETGARVEANLYEAQQHREGWVTIERIDGEDNFGRYVSIVKMTKGLGGRVTRG